MHRKRVPIFYKVSNMLRTSSIFVCKMRKPAIPKLIFLKKSRKLKRFLLLKSFYVNKYNNHACGFLRDYEFSPSSTPLINHFHKKITRSKKHGTGSSYKDRIYTMIFMCICLQGGFKGGEMALPLDTVLPAASASAVLPADEYLQPLDLWDEEESVDQRAERFIARFYSEIRMQRY